MNISKFFKSVSFFLLGALFFFQSCSVESETHFNKNMSGSTVSYMDMSELIDMAGSFGGEDAEMDELKALFSGEALPDSMQTVLDSVSMLMKEAGLHNFEMGGYDGKGFKISFDFDDLDALNGNEFMNMMADEMGEGEEMPTEMMSLGQGASNFSWDGKWLEFSPGGDSFDSMMAEMKNEAGDGEDEEVSQEEFEAGLDMMMGMFGSSMSFKQKYTFARKVKEVESPIDYVAGKKEVIFTYNLSDIMKLMKEEEDSKIRIRLK